ncbi:MAG: class I SAM-dependent methyltransferase [Planctomycetes bacterium]|nr:class I SAM-dependent methyltransferase [Planctomycetota bacterium]
MSAVTAPGCTEQGVAQAVYTCYDLLGIAPECGITDLTDGKYIDDRNDHAAYLTAQCRQAEYLLDQVRCRPGTRLLDIGCGYGRILEHAARRGAQPVGITVSPRQVAYCHARGLTVHKLNYRHLFGCGSNGNWQGAYDALVANGSLEHFVQAADAAAGRTHAIYEEMFAICRRLLAANGRFVTTAIHFREIGQFDPREIIKGRQAHPRGSPNYQFALLEESFGGWYPEPGQLERCAATYFTLVEEEDGTHDYHLTSEYWLRQFKSRLLFSPRVWRALARKWWSHPHAFTEMLRCQLWDQSWAWQFRPPAPMRLLRQTWLAR